MKFLLVLTCVLLVAGGGLQGQAVERKHPKHKKHHVKVKHVQNCKKQKESISSIRENVWKLQSLMAEPKIPSAFHERWAVSCNYVHWIARKWQHHLADTVKRFHFPPRLSAWLCIHKYEGSWTDPNSPYYGGLQMDYSFQNTYGKNLLRQKGTADHWTPLEQIWVAERAYKSGRGFYPWPNTARYCGLI